MRSSGFFGGDEEVERRCQISLSLNIIDAAGGRLGWLWAAPGLWKVNKFSEVTILVKRTAGEWTASVSCAAGRGGKGVEVCELTVSKICLRPAKLLLVCKSGACFGDPKNSSAVWTPLFVCSPGLRGQ